MEAFERRAKRNIELFQKMFFASAGFFWGKKGKFGSQRTLKTF